MRVIDLLKMVLNNEKGDFKFYVLHSKSASKTNCIHWIYKDGRVTCDDGDSSFGFMLTSAIYNFDMEIEIIEEETTQEQNFTGWKMFQSGKVVYSYGYDEPALKPADIADVEKDIKEMLEEKPKKIEKLNLDTDELLKNVNITAQEYVIEGKINEIIDYLLEKESNVK